MTADTCACDAQPTDDDRQCPACGASVTGRQPVTPLRDGMHVWLWPQRGWPSDVPAFAAQIRAAGFVGVIAQAGLASPTWIAAHADDLRAADLQVTAGFGLDGAHPCDAIVAALGAGLDHADAIMLDWESPALWERASGRDLARSIVAGVLAAHPDAAMRSADCPWWKPEVHDGAPDREFGALCSQRFVQAYGAPTAGASTAMLAHARLAYPHRGTDAGRVLPAFQLYHRTVADVVSSLISEPVAALWDWQEMDAESRCGVACVAALRAKGFATVAAFQTSAGLTADGVVGPKTCAALGVAWPS